LRDQVTIDGTSIPAQPVSYAGYPSSGSTNVYFDLVILLLMVFPMMNKIYPPCLIRNPFSW
ncbi:hypothetical protein RZN22_17385, partial [Bacillaceae bacterium S4-13-58]